MSQPENVECRTCGGRGEVPAHITVDRWKMVRCPNCKHTPENVETSNECGHSRGELRADQECEIDRTPENVECPTCDGKRSVRTECGPECDNGVHEQGRCQGSWWRPCPECSTPDNVETSNDSS